MSVQAKKVPDIMRALHIPGAWQQGLPNGAAGMQFVCPCGCGNVEGVAYADHAFSGTDEAPTLAGEIASVDKADQPILITLTDGVWS